MTKVVPDLPAAVAESVRDGMTIAMGGFGLCGIPRDLIEAVRDTGVRDLTVVSNNMGVDGKGSACCWRTIKCAKSLRPT